MPVGGDLRYENKELKMSRTRAFLTLVAVALLLGAFPPVGSTTSYGSVSADEASLEASLEAFESSGRLLDPRETHLSEVKQLTFGGENAEAYWSPDGRTLSFQSSRPPETCDQIFVMAADGSGEPKRVSSGLGRTTCAYYTRAGDRVLYSSTHSASSDCPPTPDHSQGYVWPIYDSYQIYSAAPDGSDLVALTDTDAYDAEATVCPVDGSIVFTSTRDGDLDLYRMDADGGNVTRLTNTPGYDGGAFFSQDCSKIVWRASRFEEGEALEDYRRLLSQGLVRPSHLELWVANADGSQARQVTYLGAATFAPYFYPSGDRIIFSSNYGGSPREFDIWAVNVDGTDLERITYAPGFDGFPIFSPDGQRLAFSSNRNQGKPGETDVYVARWKEHPPKVTDVSAADRLASDIAWLAADERQGRGLTTDGLRQAQEWLAQRFEELGLEPAGKDGTYFLPFEAAVSVEVREGTSLAIDGRAVPKEAFRPAAFSGSIKGLVREVIDAGYGISAPGLERDDYKGLMVRGKIVVVRRFTPPGEAFSEGDAGRRYSDLRYKAFNAREHGAVALIVVDLPQVEEGADLPEEAPFPSLALDGKGDAGLPVVHLSREWGARLFEAAGVGSKVALNIDLKKKMALTANVVAKISSPDRSPGRKAIVVGAHYDHLGFGGSGSMAPDSHEPHNGADDNASGTAAVLEIARRLMDVRQDLPRDVFLVAFSGEESGLLGSTAFTRHPPEGASADDLFAMLNLDMVGRLRDNRVTILGGDSAQEWDEIVPPLCRKVGVRCSLSGDGYGPSDQTPFYAAGVPVLHFFTGAHEDYHKPSDDASLVHAVGAVRIAGLVTEVVGALGGDTELTYQQVPAPAPAGDRRSYGAYLGTIPDYAGAEDGSRGVLLSGAREGSPAAAAGFERGDRLIGLGKTEIGDIYDFVFVLRQHKPGETVKAVVVRDGEEVSLEVTFGSRGKGR